MPDPGAPGRTTHPAVARTAARVLTIVAVTSANPDPARTAARDATRRRPTVPVATVRPPTGSVRPMDRAATDHPRRTLNATTDRRRTLSAGTGLRRRTLSATMDRPRMDRAGTGLRRLPARARRPTAHAATARAGRPTAHGPTPALGTPPALPMTANRVASPSARPWLPATSRSSATPARTPRLRPRSPVRPPWTSRTTRFRRAPTPRPAPTPRRVPHRDSTAAPGQVASTAVRHTSPGVRHINPAAHPCAAVRGTRRFLDR